MISCQMYPPITHAWVVLCFRSPADEDVVHDSFKELIEEQSQDLTSYAEAIEMYPLKEETGGIHTHTHRLSLLLLVLNH